MKKHFKFLPILFLGLCLLLNSCSPENVDRSIDTNSKNETFLVKSNEVNYLTDYEASLIANQLITNLDLFSQNISGPTVDLSNEMSDFWRSNQSTFDDVIEFTDEESITLDPDGEQFLPSVTIDDINASTLLSSIQKQYSIDLLVAAENNDLVQLIEIKNNYYVDVVDYPELQIYSLIFALINESESILFQKSDPDCREQALQSALVGGVIGMVSGVVFGGMGGFAVGGILSFGILAVPGGMTGVVVGGVGGALLGFAEEYVRSYITCKFWSWSW